LPARCGLGLVSALLDFMRGGRALLLSARADWVLAAQGTKVVFDGGHCW